MEKTLKKLQSIKKILLDVKSFEALVASGPIKIQVESYQQQRSINNNHVEKNSRFSCCCCCH